jgi:hypothetical protein
MVDAHQSRCHLAAALLFPRANAGNPHAEVAASTSAPELRRKLARAESRSTRTFARQRRALPRLGAHPTLGRGPGADRAGGRIVAARRAVLAAEVGDLQLAVPVVDREQPLQVALGLGDVARARQPPPASEPVDVGVDGKRGSAEGLSHDHARGLVADARQRFQRLEVGRYFAAVLDEHDLGQRFDRPRLLRGQAT